VKPEDVQAVELVFDGWVFGVMTCLLYAAISNYRAVTRRNRRHRDLLAAGVDPLTILRMDESV
jgi:hypothetical protein